MAAACEMASEPRCEHARCQPPLRPAARSTPHSTAPSALAHQVQQSVVPTTMSGQAVRAAAPTAADNSAVLPRHFAVVKVDVEGAEYDVLQACSTSAARARCRWTRCSSSSTWAGHPLCAAKGARQYALRELPPSLGRAPTAACSCTLSAGGCMNGNHRQSGRPVPRCSLLVGEPTARLPCGTPHGKHQRAVEH